MIYCPNYDEYGNTRWCCEIGDCEYEVYEQYIYAQYEAIPCTPDQEYGGGRAVIGTVDGSYGLCTAHLYLLPYLNWGRVFIPAYLDERVKKCVLYYMAAVNGATLEWE